MLKHVILSGSAIISSATFSKLGSWEKLYGSSDLVWTLNQNGSLGVDEAFKKIYSYFHRDFDFNAYEKMSSDFIEGLNAYGDVDVYRSVRSLPHCDPGNKGALPVTALASSHVAAL
jgi:hypothetical protein